jgi:toxin-antitoxin system PIN domain toxin
VTLADTNIWLALSLSKHSFHDRARSWLDQLDASDSLCFCRSTQQSFLRLITTKAVMSPYGIEPLSNKAAWGVFDDFLSDTRIGWLDEPAGLNPRWKKLASGSNPSPKLWMDAYLAAFALVQPCRLVTTDKAFRQFKGLDPIVLI